MGNHNNGGLKLSMWLKNTGRFEMMHVKDMIPKKQRLQNRVKPLGNKEKFVSTILGKGVVGTKEICNIGRTTGGTKYFIVEQESYQVGYTALQCSQQDYSIMKNWAIKAQSLKRKA
jgi:hypothetical protein